MKAFIIILIVVGALVGGLLTLRSTRNAGMPNKDIMDRAKGRARAQAEKDEKESKR
jgi:hypothetical protein